MFRLKNNLITLVILLVFIVSPVFVFTMPLFVSSLLFDSPDKIIFISYSNRYITYFLILMVVTFALGILYFIKTAIIKTLTMIFTILLSITIICVSTMHYLYLDENFIKYNPLFGPSIKYDWEEIEHVIHESYNAITDKEEKYIFIFYDGFVIEFEPTTEMNSSIREELTNIILELEVSFEEY